MSWKDGLLPENTPTQVMQALHRASEGRAKKMIEMQTIWFRDHQMYIKLIVDRFCFSNQDHHKAAEAEALSRICSALRPAILLRLQGPGADHSSAEMLTEDLEIFDHDYKSYIGNPDKPLDPYSIAVREGRDPPRQANS